MKYLTIFIFLLSVCLFLDPKAIFAGGQDLIYFNVTPNSILAPGQEFVVRPTVYTDSSDTTLAVGWPIIIKLQNPQPGDYIAQSSNTTDNNGTVYAKVISKVPGSRLVYAQVTEPDGTVYTSKNTYVLNYSLIPTPTLSPTLEPGCARDSYGNINCSSAPQSSSNNFSTPTLGPNCTKDQYGNTSCLNGNPTAGRSVYNPFTTEVTYQKLVGNNKREIGLQWNPISGTIKYNVYLLDANQQQLGGALLGTGSTYTTITINADQDYYVRVNACQSAEACLSTPSVYLPKLNQEQFFPLRLISVTPGNGYKENVMLSWDPVPGTVKYNIYLKNSSSASYGGAIAGIGQTTYIASVNSNLDNYFMVGACSSANSCNYSNDIFVPATKNTASGDLQNLNQQVNKLQQQVQQTQQQESVLESLVTSIGNFLHSIFPAFTQ